MHKGETSGRKNAEFKPMQKRMFLYQETHLRMQTQILAENQKRNIMILYVLDAPQTKNSYELIAFRA